MQMLVLSGSAVSSVLGYTECADAMRAALIARANGEVFQPLRTVLKPDRADGLMVLMPSFQAGTDAGYGLKAICVTPGNPSRGLDSHQGIVLLSSSKTGEPLAVLNASALTEIRTAAVSAVATEVLASRDADVLAIIGTGVQARAHLRAITSTRPIAQIRVAGRTLEKATKFLAELGPEITASTKLIGCASVQQAVEGANIIVTATNSTEPVLRREWLTPGVHINAVGACLPHMRELDTATVADAALFGDSRDSVLTEAGDYVLAAAEGVIGPDHIQAELGELLAGGSGHPGRAADREITIFESLGLAVEDLAAAALAYRIAWDRGLGTWIDFD
ncbi:MAG TPA: ornithine cyclodeaminase family protein [Streptosporangiaceae bacterium]|jgi:ornithine cyclodeaminase/alanine dehydrogenase-like protein (mu-crystallin family)|nr:ornithine cyclodeaminase family protein [Streptosporangiaceae bacterium]